MTPESVFDPVSADRTRLLDLARSLLGTQADAEDAVQDAYLRAMVHSPQALATPQAWLTTVVRHIAIDRLRHRRLEAAWVESESPGWASLAAPSAEDEASRRMACHRALRLVADLLTPIEAAIVLLREVFDIDHMSIAERAGKNEATCRQIAHRALSRLRPASSSGERHRPATRQDDGETADAVFVLCLRAIEDLTPAPLFAILAAPD